MAPKKNIDLTHVFENRNFNAQELAKTILENKLENELLIYALNDNQLISNRAIWVLTHCADIEPERIRPFHEILINHLKKNKLHSGVVRSIVRIFQTQPVPKKLQSFMLDKCYDFIKNPSEAIAVRAFAMTVVFNISKPYPELLNELSLVLNHMSETEDGPGIRSRVKNTIKAIRKLQVK